MKCIYIERYDRSTNVDRKREREREREREKERERFP